MRMGWRFRQEVCDNPLSHFPRVLILFLNNLHVRSRFDIRPISSIHNFLLSRIFVFQMPCNVIAEWNLRNSRLWPSQRAEHLPFPADFPDRDFGTRMLRDCSSDRECALVRTARMGRLFARQASGPPAVALRACLPAASDTKGDMSTETSAPRLRPHFTLEPSRWIKAFWRTPTLADFWEQSRECC